MSESLRFKRIMIKISGEALAGGDKVGFDTSVVSKLAAEIRDARDMGIEIALVIGGGNIFRGSYGETLGIERATGDYMGMLATVMNALAMQNALEKIGVPTRVMSAIEMKSVAEPYIRRRAMRHLEKGRVVIFSGGTGNPFFTTDTAASLRAVEIGAEVLMKATKVDGVFDKDPAKYPDAVKTDSISYIEVIQKQLRVMDLTAISLCMDNNMPIVVFNLFENDSILRFIRGERIGTTISQE
ncbi:MAG: UMP kinase [Spirochaetota bacterium]